MGGINEWPLPRRITVYCQHIDHFSHHYAAHSLRLLTNFSRHDACPCPSFYICHCSALSQLLIPDCAIPSIGISSSIPSSCHWAVSMSTRGQRQAADCAENSPQRPSFGQTGQNPLFAVDRGLTPGGWAINIRTVSTRQAIPP